jgi:hypothetical protein
MGVDWYRDRAWLDHREQFSLFRDEITFMLKHLGSVRSAADT